MRAVKKFLAVANWKMNKTANETAEFAKKFRKVSTKKVEVVICPPFTSLSVLSCKLKNTKIKTGAQNMFYEDSGTFTGEVSPLMIKEFSDYVIIGHSDRRKILGETDEMVNKKVKKALEHGLIPIVCVGETLEERGSGKGKEVVERELHRALRDVGEHAVMRLDLAYEPLWAISKGAADKKTQTATPKDAEEMHIFIRGVVADLYGKTVAEKVRIIYGGSVRADSVSQFTAMRNVDGVLVGGASLDPESFHGVVENADKSLSGKGFNR